MQKLPLSFALLTSTGYWRPKRWPANSFKCKIYNIYSAFMILLLYTFAFCILVDSAISKDLTTLTNKFSLVISVLGVCFKVANLFLQRESIISVVETLLTKNCTPQNEQEEVIQRKFDNRARKLTIYCEILNESAVLLGVVAPLSSGIDSRPLPLSDWVPYELSSTCLYTMTVLHQAIGLMVCANASVANETLIAGLMIQVGAQFEIFCHRVKNLPALVMEAEKRSVSAVDFRNRRRRIVKDLIQYHLEIYEQVYCLRRVDVIELYMIFLQFSISSTVLCMTIYKLSTEELFSLQFCWNISYLCCMLMQVYLYCWFGNEVTLQSLKVSNAIYEMDWTMLPARVTKDFLMVMVRSRRPVRMTSGHVVNLSSESLMAIMKITYSSYNILKDSSSK